MSYWKTRNEPGKTKQNMRSDREIYFTRRTDVLREENKSKSGAPEKSN